jgi:hypothetical protein
VICGVTSNRKGTETYSVVATNVPPAPLPPAEWSLPEFANRFRLPLTVIQSRNARRGDGFRLTFRFSSGNQSTNLRRAENAGRQTMTVFGIEETKLLFGSSRYRPEDHLV